MKENLNRFKIVKILARYSQAPVLLNIIIINDGIWEKFASWSAYYQLGEKVVSCERTLNGRLIVNTLTKKGFIHVFFFSYCSRGAIRREWSSWLETLTSPTDRRGRSVIFRSCDVSGFITQRTIRGNSMYRKPKKTFPHGGFPKTLQNVSTFERGPKWGKLWGQLT